MSDELTAWLSQELEQRRLSFRQLAKQAGVSHVLISKVLSGKMPPSPDFCLRIAAALGEPPEKLLRLAGHLPPRAEPGEDSQAVKDLLETARRLPPEDQQDVLDFARFRYQKRRSGPK